MRSPTASVRPVAEAVQRRQHQLGLGFAHDLRLPSAGHFDGGQDRAGAGPQAVRLGVGRIASGGQEVGPAAHRQCGVAKVVVHELLGAADHDHLGARGQVGAVEHPEAGVPNVCVQSRCADHEGRVAAAGLGEEVLHCTAHGDHVAHGRLGPDSPETGHVILGCAARIVGGVGDPLPASRSMSRASSAPGVGSSPIQIQPSRSKMNWS